MQNVLCVGEAMFGMDNIIRGFGSVDVRWRVRNGMSQKFAAPNYGPASGQS